MRAAIGAYHPLAARSYGTPTKTDTFTYGNTDWKDRLTAYNGVGITYDGSGNPLSYRGMILSWQKGRQLASIIKDGTAISFTYDSRGHRIRKTIGSNANDQTVTRYFYNGDTLIGLVKGNQTVQFVYDTEGRPFLMRVYDTGSAGTTNSAMDYYYLYNGQGDVTGLIDSSNHDVVHYIYDSWGKMVSLTDTSDVSISTLNPFRYRGYIYDPETEFYYPGSRYYDAAIGRWIGADRELSEIGGNIRGYNLYTYCFNSPVGLIDIMGKWPSWGQVFAAVATVAVTALAVVSVIAAAPAVSGAVMSTAVVVSVPQTFSYPSTGRSDPENLKEQIGMNLAKANPDRGEVIIKSLNDMRMPGWLGWQKYQILFKEAGVKIHYVGNKFFPFYFDFKFKE